MLHNVLIHDRQTSPYSGLRLGSVLNVVRGYETSRKFTLGESLQKFLINRGVRNGLEFDGILPLLA